MQFDISNAEAPGLLRRLAAIFYDIWLIFAIWLLGVTVHTFVATALGVEEGEGNFLPLQIYFVVSPFLFYLWFWRHGGQTLGMRSWNLILLTDDGETVSFMQALIRYVTSGLSWAVCGVGFLWVLIDAEKLAWHDTLSRTRLVVIEKRKKSD